MVMIGDRHADAPPSYDNTVAEGSSQVGPPVEKGSASTSRTAQGPGPSSPSTPSPSIAKSRAVQKTTWMQFRDDMGNMLADVVWEVRKTVTGLVHDLVRDQTLDSNMSCSGILDSCSEQSYIEGHTPLYWAIVKRPSDESKPESFEAPPLIRALLIYSAPLKDTTIKDIRLALAFPKPTTVPEFQALSQKDRLLLGDSVPPDKISIGPATRHDAPISVDFEFAHFQKRMRVSHLVKLDFISHARMWEISFFVAEGNRGLTDGQWAARIGLCENSPTTSMSAIYTLEQHASPPLESAPENTSLTLSGKLTVDQNIDMALPDAIQYPGCSFLTADGTLRGKLILTLTS
ncbi:hypothetical protein B0H10DRAFT_1985031 [Mycena sp. CBHHK59/15]|nr:hypothetical protein B0H10DRAFT_1985031 [Mycena sp. CBHHK59/15]